MGPSVFGFGVILLLWVLILLPIMLREDKKIPGTTKNSYVLVPVGVTLLVWLFIFSLVLAGG